MTQFCWTSSTRPSIRVTQVAHQPCDSMTYMILATVGMPGSGKTSVSEYLSSKGWPVVRFGQIVIDEVRRQGLDINPTNERLVREALRKQHGMDVCARRSVPAIS